jgi:hypothetical protein
VSSDVASTREGPDSLDIMSLVLEVTRGQEQLVDFELVDLALVSRGVLGDESEPGAEVEHDVWQLREDLVVVDQDRWSERRKVAELRT